MNVITWNTPSNGTLPAQYLIYRNSALTDLAGVVSATGPLEFRDHNRQKNQPYSYFVVSQTQSGATAAAANVTVLP